MTNLNLYDEYEHFRLVENLMRDKFTEVAKELHWRIWQSTTDPDYVKKETKESFLRGWQYEITEYGESVVDICANLACYDDYEYFNIPVHAFVDNESLEKFMAESVQKAVQDKKEEELKEIEKRKRLAEFRLEQARSELDDLENKQA